MKTEELELEKEAIMGEFHNLSRDDLLLFISKNLYFNEDFGINEWEIGVDFRNMIEIPEASNE